MYIIIQNLTRSLYSSIHSPLAENNKEINYNKSKVSASKANQVIQEVSNNPTNNGNINMLVINNTKTNKIIENNRNYITQNNIIDTGITERDSNNNCNPIVNL